MSETKFTKGEWEVLQTDNYIEVTAGRVSISYEPNPTDEEVANAHLIAAAPEVYDMLSTIKRAILSMSICDSYLYDLVEKDIDPLLAKARGE